MVLGQPGTNRSGESTLCSYLEGFHPTMSEKLIEFSMMDIQLDQEVKFCKQIFQFICCSGNSSSF